MLTQIGVKKVSSLMHMYEVNQECMFNASCTTDQVHVGSIYTNLEMECMHVELGMYIDRHPKVCMQELRLDHCGLQVPVHTNS